MKLYELNCINKKECLEHLKHLIASCKEGKSGQWDCTTDEGKEGFDAMRESLEAVRGFVKAKR